MFFAGEDPFVTVPKHYQRMLMRYTKLDDFDFRHYNKTNYAGLIAEQANSYCNGMLQVKKQKCPWLKKNDNHHYNDNTTAKV